MDKATRIYRDLDMIGDEDNSVTIWDFGHYTNRQQLYEINKISQKKGLLFDYPHIGGTPPPEEFLSVIFICFRFVYDVGVETAVEALKWSVLQILKLMPADKNPSLVIEYLDVRYTLDYGFNLNEAQKGKIVDAGIEILKERISNEHFKDKSDVSR